MEISILDCSQRFELAFVEKNKDKVKSALLDLSLQSATKEQAVQLVSDALILFDKNEALYKCTPQSILGGFMTALQLKMSLHPATQFCYLIPYWNSSKGVMEAQFQFGYRGLETMVKRAYTGAIVTFDADVVTKKEIHLKLFSIVKGSKIELKHQPLSDRSLYNEDIAGAYGVCMINGVCVAARYLSKFDVEVLRLRNANQTNKQGNTDPKNAWKSDYAGMAQAKALKTLCSKLSTEIQKYDESVIVFNAQNNETTVETSYTELDETFWLDKVEQAKTVQDLLNINEAIPTKSDEIRLKMNLKKAELVEIQKSANEAR